MPARGSAQNLPGDVVYQMLKCNFHAHYYESYGRDATAVLDAHRAAGYDCVALTEHFCFLPDLEVEEKARCAEPARGGEELIVIVGEEASFAVTGEEGVHGKDVVCLFLDRVVRCEVEPHPAPSTEVGPLIPLSTGLELVHEQGGIAVVVHDAWGVWWDRRFDGKERGLWVWDRRRDLAIDAWEVGNGWARFEQNAPGLDLMLSHPRESVDEGYIVLANSDAHAADQVSRLGACCTYLFVSERSAAGVRDALLERRCVAYCDGQVFGRGEWVERWRSAAERGVGALRSGRPGSAAPSR